MGGPICTTELGYMTGLKPAFEQRNCKVIGLGVDSVDDHVSESPRARGMLPTTR
jgi:alkyl hydroperoxide reductase subunit AhpC